MSRGPEGPVGYDTIGLTALTVPCPWAPEGLATPGRDRQSLSKKHVYGVMCIQILTAA